VSLNESGIIYLKVSSAAKKSRGFVFHPEPQVGSKTGVMVKKQDAMSQFVTTRRVSSPYSLP